MKVVILAAGVGSRLRPLTDSVPKCLVKVNGIEILQYQIKAFKNAGLNDIYIVVGYKGDKIREFCKANNYNDIKIIENNEYETTNNMYSLNLAQQYVLGQDFIFCNADVVYHQAIISELLSCAATNAIGVQFGSYTEESMKVTLGEDGNISNISKAIEQHEALGNSIDLYKISAQASVKLFNELEKRLELSKNDWTELALQSLMKENIIAFFAMDIDNRPWFEIDNYDDLMSASKLFSPTDVYNKKAIFLDLDGTVYLDNILVEGALEFFSTLKEKGIAYYFLTNNSSKTKADYIKKISGLKIEVDERNIILSTDGLIDYLKKNNIKNIYAVAPSSVCDYFESIGINPRSDNPEYVVVTFDTELSYAKLKGACYHIQNGVEYIATHKDMICPTSAGNIPDAGSITQMLETTTGKKPAHVFGKPDVKMISHILENNQLTPHDIAIIGDRIYTDMQMAVNIGSDFVLVLTGETKHKDLNNINYDKCLVINALQDLL